MIKTILFVVPFLFIQANNIDTTDHNKRTVVINVENIEAAGGIINIAIYSNKKDYLKEDKAVLYRFPVEQKGHMAVEIENVLYGAYAFAIFHDLNGDDELDTNFLGAPTEPYGFSGPKQNRWLPPSFESAKVTVDQTTLPLNIRLNRFRL